MESNQEETGYTTNLLSVLELIEEINKLKVNILTSKVAYINQVEAIRDLQNAEMKLIASEHPARAW
jgi:hypothetical protein